MDGATRIRRRLALRVHQILARGVVDEQSQRLRITDHPGQRHFRERRLLLRVAATHVGVDAGEPDLLAIRLLPFLRQEQIRWEAGAALIDGQGVAEVGDRRVNGRVRQGVEVPEPAEGTDGVPGTDEVDQWLWGPPAKRCETG